MKEPGVETITNEVITPEQYAKTFKTLRDEFAMAALPIAFGCHEESFLIEDDHDLIRLRKRVSAAYEIADACMAEREKKP